MQVKRKSIRKTRDQLALAAVTGPSGAVAYSNQLLTERPTAINSIFKRCRVVAEESSFLSTYLPLKLAFYNYGFSLTTGPAAKGDDAALDKWLNEDFTTDVEYTDPSTKEVVKVELNQTNGEAIRALLSDVWREFNLLDTCVLQWFDGGNRAPTTLPPEQCRYLDKLGTPVLYYTHGLSRQEIQLLDPDQQTRFSARGEVLLNPQYGEHFKVLKRGLAGTGFTKPGLYSLLRTLGEIDAKEVGYHGQAYIMRAATRHHKLGHEIKQGNHAGKGTWFWNLKRDRAVRAEFKDRQGPHDFTSNFDHTIDYPWPDVARFDETAWKGTNLRLRNWGGPIAQMLLADKVIDGGLAFLRAQATEDRSMVADLVRPAIKAVFNPPENLDVQLTWSDLIFNNPAQAAELLKFATQQGLASWKTAREMIGLNDAKESAQKLREAEDKDSLKKFLPAFDMSHGTAPGLGILELSGGGGGGDGTTPAKGKGANPGNKNGRPTGSPNAPA